MKTQSDWGEGVRLLLATVVGAAAGIVGQLIIQGQGNARADSLTNEHARGAARVLFAEFFESLSEMTVLEHDRIVQRFTPQYRIQIQPNDMTLIAAKLSGEQWGKVQDALVEVQSLDTFMSSLTDRRQKRLKSSQACYVAQDMLIVRWAESALAPLAGAPGHDSPPATRSC